MTFVGLAGRSSVVHRLGRGDALRWRALPDRAMGDPQRQLQPQPQDWPLRVKPAAQGFGAGKSTLAWSRLTGWEVRAGRSQDIASTARLYASRGSAVRSNAVRIPRCGAHGAFLGCRYEDVGSWARAAASAHAAHKTEMSPPTRCDSPSVAFLANSEAPPNGRGSNETRGRSSGPHGARQGRPAADVEPRPPACGHKPCLAGIGGLGRSGAGRIAGSRSRLCGGCAPTGCHGGQRAPRRRRQASRCPSATGSPGGSTSSSRRSSRCVRSAADQTSLVGGFRRRTVAVRAGKRVVVLDRRPAQPADPIDLRRAVAGPLPAELRRHRRIRSRPGPAPTAGRGLARRDHRGGRSGGGRCGAGVPSGPRVGLRRSGGDGDGARLPDRRSAARGARRRRARGPGLAHRSHDGCCSAAVSCCWRSPIACTRSRWRTARATRRA